MSGEEISVASSLFNLAGDEANRPQFLKSLIIRNVLSGTKRSMGETVSAGYLSGPGIKFRSFFRWAEDNYDHIGMPEGVLRSTMPFTPSDLGPYISVGSNEYAWVQDAWAGPADFMFWAERWIRENRPNKLDTIWTADINPNTSQIKITFDDLTTATFIPGNYDANSKYVYGYYNIMTDPVFGPLVPGTPIVLDEDQSFPSTSGYILNSDSSTTQTVDLDTTVTTVVSYSDARPDVVTTDTSTTPASYLVRTRQYYRDTHIPGVDDEVVSNRAYLNLYENKTVQVATSTTTTTHMEGSVTVTTTVTTEAEVLADLRSHRTDTQVIIQYTWSELKTFLYRLGTGISFLDALIQQQASYGKFFPMIPIRLDGEMVTNDTMPETYAIAKKAYRKATDGGRYDKILAEIADHEDVEDMDYVYAVFGVSLNVVEKSCRKYIYKFFQKLMADQAGGANLYDNFRLNTQAHYAAMQAWATWRDSPSGPEPVIPPRPTLTTNEIRINSTGEIDTAFDMRISWLYMDEEIQNGKGRPEAKTGDIWFQDLGTDDFSLEYYNGVDEWGNPVYGLRPSNFDKYRIYWQFEDNRYRYIDIVGMVHRNYIYGGRFVETSVREALTDSDESGFIVPLHYGTYTEMSIKDSTQMATACLFLVVNSYEARKKEWWESWWFQVIIVVVVAIASVTLTGGAGFGLLGSHLAVGGSLGFTGMTAAIIGSVANALAALVLSTMLGYLTTAIFGEEFGALIGAIMGMMISSFASSLANGGIFSFNLSDLMKAENLLKLTDAAVSAYTAVVNRSITDMQAEAESLQKSADAELKRIQNEFYAQFGVGGQIDPLWFVDNTPVIAESRDTFLTRTLLTGSDIAEMSFEILSDFTTLSLTLPNAFT